MSRRHFWMKYGPYAFFLGGGVSVLCNRARKSGPIFIPARRLRQLCQKSATMVNLWLGCSTNMHTHKLSCLHSRARLKIPSLPSSVSPHYIKATPITLIAVNKAEKAFDRAAIERKWRSEKTQPMFFTDDKIKVLHDIIYGRRPSPLCADVQLRQSHAVLAVICYTNKNGDTLLSCQLKYTSAPIFLSLSRSLDHINTYSSTCLRTWMRAHSLMLLQRPLELDQMEKWLQ